MAYADQKQNRTVAIGSVALVHAALGAALLSGLVVDATRTPVDPPIDIYTVETPPPPPPDPVPPPPKPATRVQPQTRTPELVVTPIPLTPVTPTIDLGTTSVIPEVAPVIDAPPVQPSPPAEVRAANLSRGAAPKGNQGDWFLQDSYPPAARRAGAEGLVGITVDVAPSGRVTACRVTASSGNDDLDATTCRLATRNGRFTPALDASGAPVGATVKLRNVRWRLEE